MRQTTKNGITIKYADAVGFASLPCIIKASGSGVASIETNISRDTRNVTIQRTLIERIIEWMEFQYI